MAAKRTNVMLAYVPTRDGLRCGPWTRAWTLMAGSAFEKNEHRGMVSEPAGLLVWLPAIVSC